MDVWPMSQTQTCPGARETEEEKDGEQDQASDADVFGKRISTAERAGCGIGRGRLVGRRRSLVLRVASVGS